MTPREELIFEGLENHLISIQQATQFSSQLLKWEERLLRMNRKEIKKTAREIAAKFERYYTQKEQAGQKADPNDLKQMLQNELSHI